MPTPVPPLDPAAEVNRAGARLAAVPPRRLTRAVHEYLRAVGVLALSRGELPATAAPRSGFFTFGRGTTVRGVRVVALRAHAYTHVLAEEIGEYGYEPDGARARLLATYAQVGLHLERAGRALRRPWPRWTAAFLWGAAVVLAAIVSWERGMLFACAVLMVGGLAGALVGRLTGPCTAGPVRGLVRRRRASDAGRAEHEVRGELAAAIEECAAGLDRGGAGGDGANGGAGGGETVAVAELRRALRILRDG